ncbi:serine/threonine-protein kinase [Corallococcus macrosporus]|uniref:Protein kinase n=1 Tax=Corallococcus macrosporus DSM 14697 TaxID=1189310 RepID=A0A286NVZ9_9BACT|nr:serine/threonine-protein kinase [Corallococcus macrosporus]ATB51344.1 protein kinase [Corallococcus macrosporus DSM 14697]
MLVRGTQVGAHVIVRRVAVGAFSDVYSGLHAVDGTQVAVKVLSASSCLHEELVARFLNEGQSLRDLRHPGLVRALDLGLLPDGPPFIVLEWLPTDLEQALARAGGCLPVRTCAEVLGQVAAALDALHVHGLIHRDVKPANILVARLDAEDVTVKLADLGLAKRVATGPEAPAALPVSTAGTAVLGSWDFMAPEQWLDAKRVDARVDVYSLGVLGFQLLAGQLPFGGGTQKELMIRHLRMPPPLHLLGDEVPASLRGLLGRMMAKAAGTRPPLMEVRECVAGLVFR